MSSSPSGRFERIVLIYNPDAVKFPFYLAEQLREDLALRLPAVPVQLRHTKSAGHARELARAAAGEGRPLIVSISGDGGFNEVVNGVMDVPETQAVCAVMAGGNANDHRRSTRRQALIEAIVDGEVRQIDLLRLRVGDGPQAWSRYAHSYVGFGLTPLMAIGIEGGQKGVIKELISVARTVAGLRPFEIARADGARARLDSLVLANIPEMAKYGRVSESGDPADGRFEVVMLPHASKWRIALMTLRAVTVGLGEQPSVSSYAFTTTDSIPVQTDGEVMTVSAETDVVVESVPRALTVIG
ncbi:diacylglycerol/lipid kinase family protein [Crystallibacter degradans]|uniref:diacylglycerol/lipid kinase family protein n=1 Tax=Crystallibacter degradans TaxID=2726743 RepID=UPI001473B3D2|nr:diacylglycerol kinase family protein [Arthrobacter sp. SF27]NMR28425.1 diacylglycerol kinase [Arthrobacter sp. SF27]